MFAFILVIYGIYYIKRRKLPNRKDIKEIIMYGAILFGSISSIINILLGIAIFPEIEEEKNLLLLVMSLILISYSFDGIEDIIKKKKKPAQSWKIIEE